MKIFKYESFVLNRYIIIIIVCLIEFISALNFSYQNTSSWAEKWPFCGGKSQSPIDISLSSSKIIKSHSEMTIYNGKEIMKRAKLLNDGHIVKLMYEWGDRVTMISADVFNGTYRLDSTQFHWNSKSNQGSEHTFEKERAPMEMQSVFYNEKYESAIDAFNYNDGFLIFSDLLFTEPPGNQSSGPSGIHYVLSHFPNVSKPGSEIYLPPFSISTLVPIESKILTLIVYAGSLTAPPCTENVIWLLNQYPHFIDETQLKDIQNSVQLENHDSHNFRETQPLNGRRLVSITSDLD